MMTAIRVATAEQLERCLEIRKQVFVVEQGVSVEEELDHYDESPEASIHILLTLDGHPVGTGRVKAFEGKDAKLQRIAVTAAMRGKGAGSALVRAMEQAAQEDGYTGAVLDAQVQAEPFYSKLGYTAVSPEIFLDAGIPHVRMRKSLS